MSTTRATCDVAIVGGGPAGLAAALTLAEAGCVVTVIERSHYARTRIGESLPPAVRPALASLGASDLLRDHLPCQGIRSFWGDRRAERSFVFDPYGCGWHVDRQAFDEKLSRRAEERGVEIRRGSRIRACRRIGPDPSVGAWRLSVGTRSGALDLEARYLIDSSGRAASLGRRLGAVRRVEDRLVGVVGFHGPSAGHPGDETETECDPVVLVEAFEAGWWYSAPLPGGRLVTALMTDADLAPTDASGWYEMLAAAPHTAGRCTSRRRIDRLRRVAADSSRLDPLKGPGWISAGDAAVACDPLSGDGVQRAIEGGKAAGEALRDFIAKGVGLSAYTSGLARMHSAYRERRLAFYRRERRWPHATFWRRRAEVPPFLEVGEHPSRDGSSSSKPTRSAL